MSNPDVLGTAAWRKLRQVILRRDHFQCRMCGALLISGNRGPAAAVVDHIRPRRLRQDLALDPCNLQACCARCHLTICAKIELGSADAEQIAAQKAAYQCVGPDGYRIKRNHSNT